MNKPAVRLSLTLKLFLAIAAVSLCSTALVAWQVQHHTAREFDSYVLGQARSILASSLAARYAERGGWDAVAEGADLAWPDGRAWTITAAPWRMMGGGPRHMARPQFGAAVVDEEGKVIVAGPGFGRGQMAPRELLRTREAIIVDGDTVGWVIATTHDPVRAATEQAFLWRVNSALFVASAGAILLSLVLSVLLSRSLTRPVRDLTLATEALAKGELGRQVPVRAQDEVGALARSFNAMSHALARAESLRKQMTADIAHELRTPLSLILGHAEALDDGVLPPTPETMHVIHDEARRLSRLVEDLRTLTLSDAGELPLTMHPTPVAELVERTIASYRAQAQRRDIELHTEIAPDLPEVLADPDRIAQVLGNLLSNALHHTPDGGKITVSAQRENGGAVCLAVQDTGPGIVAEDLERVFERFYRTDRSRARDEGGSGLGLAIARSLVVAHGGRMWAECGAKNGADDAAKDGGAKDGAVEDGATLLFTLPAHQEEEDT